MRVIKSLAEWRELRRQLVGEIGFVPTMGNLHSGHVSLLQRSRAENAVTVLSIFVNPTQFNNPDDLLKYPRTFAEDMHKAEAAGVDYVLAPEFAELYSDNYRYQVSENSLSLLMEGASRPGHFQGMLTVVMKLLMLVKPRKAYFGEKDFQQLQLVQDMVQAFFLDVEIVPCSTQRAASGLALSSRNNLLSSEQLQQAAKFPALLKSALSCEEIQCQLQQAGFEVDYVQEHWGRRFGAVKVGSVRLIDNIEVA